MAKEIVILTESETRHTYFRLMLGIDNRFKVIGSFCEGDEKSLKNRTFENPNSSWLEKQHSIARSQSEADFFDQIIINTEDVSNPNFIGKDEINDEYVVKKIEELKPDILVCYGSSLIKSRLLKTFSGRFLNVHLGLSPYYRGSGTNVWPIINGELEMIGATYMYIDEGIDTGKIIHQIRADILLGDSPHTIGNRLIAKMTKVYADLIAAFDDLYEEKQPQGEGKLYFEKDFNEESCRKLYDQLSNGLVENFLLNNATDTLSNIVQNRVFSGSK